MLVGICDGGSEKVHASMSPSVVSSMIAPRRARKGCLTSSANRSP